MNLHPDIAKDVVGVALLPVIGIVAVADTQGCLQRQHRAAGGLQGCQTAQCKIVARGVRGNAIGGRRTAGNCRWLRSAALAGSEAWSLLSKRDGE